MYLYRTSDGKLTPYPQPGPKPLFVDSIETLASWFECLVTELFLESDGSWSKHSKK